MRRLLLAAALMAAPAAAASVEITAATGQWVQVFSNDVARMTGRNVRIDTASVAPGGLGVQFRQAATLLRAERPYPYGTTIYALRSVNCAAGVKTTHQWSAIGPNGTVLGAQALANPAPETIHWDTADGKVLKFVCQGILPR